MSDEPRARQVILAQEREIEAQENEICRLKREVRYLQNLVGFINNHLPGWRTIQQIPDEVGSLRDRLESIRLRLKEEGWR